MFIVECLSDVFQDCFSDRHPLLPVVSSKQLNHLLSRTINLAEVEPMVYRAVTENESVILSLLKLAKLWDEVKAKRDTSTSVVTFETFDQLVYILQGLLESAEGLKKIVSMLSEDEVLMEYFSCIASSLNYCQTYSTQDISLEVGKHK